MIRVETDLNNSVRIATWNLARANPHARSSTRLYALQSHMSAIDADIWVLTETWQQIAPSPAHRLIAYSVAAPDRDSGAGECWTSIWSRHPGQPIPLAAEPERTAAARIVLPGGRPFIVYGTVLPWLSDQRQAPVTGKQAFLDSLAAQSAEWAALKAKYADSALLIAGDFNQDLADKHYYGSGAGREALRTCLVQNELKCLTAGDQDPLASESGRASIDHIVVSQDVEASALAYWPEGELPRTLTDHYGVWADLDLGTEGSRND